MTNQLSGGHLDDDTPNRRNQSIKKTALYLAQINGGEPSDFAAEAERLEPYSPRPYRDDDLTAAGFKPVKTYKYTDAVGNPMYEVVRYQHRTVDGAKTFRQRRPGLNNVSWIANAGLVKVPYRWPDLIAKPDEQVFFTEGEKDADRLSDLGLLATTIAGQKWSEIVADALSGRDVLILEDNDQKGRENAQKSVKALEGRARSIRVIKLPKLKIKGDVSDWLDDGHTKEELLKIVDEARTRDPSQLHWYADADPNIGVGWTIQDLIPKTGSGLFAGQAGMLKTFAALDMAGSVMTGEPFIQFAIRRKGGVLYLAPEGGNTIPLRMRALVEKKHGDAKMPFAWATFSPRLVEPDAVAGLVKLAAEAEAKMMADFGLPLVMIFIDTIAVAAGYGSGEENDASTSQQVMSTLASLAKQTSTFVFGIDHFGKVVDTGTRGSSAKEAAADVVLAMLGKKDVTGAVTDTRLAIRKRRDGSSGEEIRCRTVNVDMGVDQYGSNMSSIVIEWLPGATQSSGKHDHWRDSRGLRTLREALSTALHDHGVEFLPKGYVAPVRAAPLKQVRGAFKLVYPPPADEEPEKRRKAVGIAFRRTVAAAHAGNLIAAEETTEDVFIWEKSDDGTM
ncbi:AAA family ATPase [Bradyrhizobium lupini]|uniref:AAA family ATPase n=1 Tax=Rhizobium lupini TaxID=136996 RepID=UPI00366D1635